MRKHVSAQKEPTVCPHILHVLYLSILPPFTDCAHEMFMISGFRHEVREICAVLGYYTAYSGVYLLIFWNNLLVPSSRVRLICPIGCSETSVRNYHHTLCNTPKECRYHLKSGHYSLLLYSGIVQYLRVQLKLHVRNNLKCWFLFM
jgi:hypothetical protein